MHLNFSKKVFIFFAFAFFYNATAQETIGLKKSSFITFNVLTPTVSYVPRYNVGYFKTINERLVLGGEIGFGNYNSSFGLGKSGAISRDYRSFEIKLELMYILNNKAKTKKFISADFSYVNHKEGFEKDSYYDLNDSKYYTYDSADYQRQKFTFNVNYGMIVNFGSRFGIIPKVGLGYKMRNVAFTNVVNKVEQDPYGGSDTDGYIFDSSGYNEKNGNKSGVIFH